MAESDSSKKIACRSRKAVNFINETLYESLNVSLQSDAQRTTEERDRYVQKFKEIFEKVSQQNIVVTGEAGEQNEPNTTPEFEAKDKEKEAQIGEELLPRLDDCVMKIAKQRKRLPRVCANAVTDFANHQAAYMSKVKPRAQAVDIEGTLGYVKEVSGFISCQRLLQPCASLAQLTKSATKDQQRAGHLQKAVEMEASNRQSQTASVVPGEAQGPAVDTTLCAHCLKKRKLDWSVFDVNVDPTRSKVARLGALLARDFAVQPLSI